MNKHEIQIKIDKISPSLFNILDRECKEKGYKDANENGNKNFCLEILKNKIHIAGSFQKDSYASSWEESNFFTLLKLIKNSNNIRP